MIQACDGLAYAHEKGVVHRDVKPGNLLMSDDGRLCVTDFGIVKLVAAAEIEGGTSGVASTSGQQTLTFTGSMRGTPAYGAPEQWKDPKTVDARADVYSLGVILFELCCGRRPFDDGSPGEKVEAIIGRHLSTPAPDPREINPDVPDVFCAIILECLAKGREQRPESAAKLRERLALAYQAVGGVAYPRQVPKSGELRADSLNNRAASLWDLGNKVGAFTAWGEALKLDGQHLESTYNEALARWREGGATDMDVLKRLQAVATGSVRGRLCLALIHLERGAFDEAEKQLVEGLRDDPGQRDALAGRSPADARMAQSADVSTVERLIRRQGEGGKYAGFHRTLHRLQGNTGKVCSVAVTGDGRYAVLASEDHRLRLWDLATDSCQRTLEGCTGDSHHLSVTPDGRYAISPGDGDLQVWELSTGKSWRWAAEARSRQMESPLALTVDGHYAASLSGRATLRVWELSTGTCMYRLDRSLFQEPLALTVDGRYALTSSRTELRFWDLATGQCLREMKWDRGRSTAVAVTPDGSFAVSAHMGGQLRFWDLSTAECLLTRAVPYSTSHVAVTADGIHAISADRDIQVWEISTGRCIRTISPATDYPLTLSVDGRCSAAWSASDCTLEVWRFNLQSRNNGAVMQLCRVPSYVVAENLDETFRAHIARAEDALQSKQFRDAYEHVCRARALAGYERDARALVLNARLASILPRTALVGAWPVRAFQEAQSGWLGRVALTPDWRRAVSCHVTAVQVWDIPTGNCLCTLEEAHFILHAFDIAADGRYIALGGDKVWIREVPSGKFLLTLAVKERSVNAVALTPDGRYVVAGSGSGTVRICELVTGCWGHTLQGHKSAIRTIVVAPDSRLAISGSDDCTLRVWETGTGKCLRTLLGHTTAVTAAAVCGDGRHAVSGGDDGVRVWDLETGECVRAFVGYDTSVVSVALTTDGRYVLSGNSDRLHVWDFATGQSLSTPEGHAGVPWAVAVAADAARAVSGNGPSPQVWQLDWELGLDARADSPDVKEP